METEERKNLAEMHRRNAELGDVVYNATIDAGGKKTALLYSEEIRKKAEKLVSQSLDKLLEL